MKYSFSFCCFELKFFLTFWSEFITFHRDNCFAQCVAIVGSQPVFFLLLSKICLDPLRYHDKSLSLYANRHSSYLLRQFQFNFVLVFHNCKCENTSFRWLDCRRLRLILDHWFIIWLLKFLSDLMFLIIILPWLRILMYFIVKTFGHKSYWFCYDLMKIIMDLVILFFILAMGFHLILTWTNFIVWF